MSQESIESGDGEWHELGREVEHLVTDPVVRAWRYESLIRAGFTASQAEVIAASAEVDVHWLIDLTAKGCPHETAYRIAGVHPLESVPSALVNAES
jgi:hypothetical protein